MFYLTIIFIRNGHQIKSAGLFGKKKTNCINMEKNHSTSLGLNFSQLNIKRVEPDVPSKHIWRF